MKFREFYKNVNVNKFLGKILLVLIPIFFIFIKFGSLSIIDGKHVAIFSLDFLYYLDVIPLSLLVILSILYFFLKDKKIVSYVMLSLIIISLIMFIVYGILLNMIVGFLVLLSLIYLIYIVLIFFSK